MFSTTSGSDIKTGNRLIVGGSAFLIPDILTGINGFEELKPATNEASYSLITGDLAWRLP